jgi:hypothetical protein
MGPRIWMSSILLSAMMLPRASTGQEQHKLSVMGLGLLSCEVWTQLHRASAGEIADQWLLGFLSGGAVFTSSNYLATSNLPDVLRRAETYCTANPKAPLTLAGLVIAKELNAPIGQPHPQ